MAIRVRDLAKEFKISSSALMKHLKDMGVDIKSPMSKIEDEIESKIRARFNAERQAVRQREIDRRNYQKKVVQTRTSDNSSKIQGPVIVKTSPPKPKPKPKKEEAEAPKRWIERPTSTSKEQQGTEKKRRPRPPRRAGSDAPERKPSTPRDQDRRSSGKEGYKKQSNYRPRPDGQQNRDDRQRRDGQQNRDDRQRRDGQQHRDDRQRRDGQQRRDNRGKPQYKDSRNRQDSRHRTDKRTDKRTDFQKRPHKPAIKPDQAVIEIKKAIKPHDKDLKKKKDYGKKNKHLEAKIKSFKKGGRKKKFTPTELEEAAIVKNIKKTLTSSGQKKKKYKKEDKHQDQRDSKLTISEFTSVSELSKLMDLKSSEIIAKFFTMGKMVTINQRLDKESLELICAEFEFEVEFAEEYGAEILEVEEDEREHLEQVDRPPVVTIMGHVDHGKTAILDYIRHSNVIAGEAGGITQHIGAYQVEYNDQRITFLDTPGHEAFTAMRARGADVTDIAIIVVAANESVKTQTIEAIDHAKAAGVTLIIAINKIDLPEANIDRTINDLMKQNLYLENYGGETLWVPCSAKTGEGIDELLDTILLAAELEELTVPKEITAKGIVIEARKDSRMGTMVTILLQEGHLSKGDNIVCGATYGKVRKFEDERHNELEEIGPSDVAVLFGLNDVPKAGDNINYVDSEKTARQISSERKLIRQERETYLQKTNLDNLFQKIKDQEMSEIKLIVKADTDGSVEALSDSFMKLSNEEVQIKIIRKAVGGINDADVSLASTLDAIIIGFHVRSSNTARKLAEDENVEIKIYQIIYNAIEDIQKAMQGMMTPELKEKLLGNARVLKVFKIDKLGQIAGCRIEKGIVTNDALLRLFRNDLLIHEGKVSSLKHYSEDVSEVRAGSECGIGIENYNDIKEDDVIEAYRIEEVEKKLDFKNR